MSTDEPVQCLRCKKVLIRAEYDNHICAPYHMGTRDIPVIQWWVTKTENGTPMIMAIGTDGYTYSLVETKRKIGFKTLDALNRQPPDERLQGKRPDEEVPEPMTAKFKKPELFHKSHGQEGYWSKG